MRWSLISSALATILTTASIGLATTIHVPSQQPTIQAGIDAAVDGDTVLVAAGYYTGEGNRDIDFLGKAIMVVSEHGPYSTSIDCEGSEEDPHRAFLFQTGEVTSSVLKGFTIKGSYCSNSLPDCGAIFCDNSSPTIRGIILEGLYEGFNDYATCGIVSYQSSPLIKRSLFVKNSYAVLSESSQEVITNCTFSMNDYAILSLNSSLSISNCILWGDEGEIRTGTPPYPNVTYCDIQGGYSGEGNIDEDPQFVYSQKYNFQGPPKNLWVAEVI